MRIFVQLTRHTIRATRMAVCLGLLMLLSGCCCTSGWIMNHSGMGYYRKGNYSMARNEFQRAVMDAPRSPDYRHNLAMAMQKQGDTATAEQVLRHNLSVDPMHQPTYHALTQMLISQQRTAEADQLLTGWRDTQPYVPEAYIEQAWFQHETGNRMAAEQSLRQALQVKPNHPVALAQLGQLYHENGQADQAAAYYQRSLASRWDQPEVKSRLASLSGPSSGGTVRRSALLQNGPNVQMVSMNQMPMDGGQQVMTAGMIPAGEAVDFEDPSLRQRRHQHLHHHQHRMRGSSAQQVTAYSLPNYGIADAGSYQGGMISAAAPGSYPANVVMSPTIVPEISSQQPAFGPPVIASNPTLILQADPAHSTEMTAGIPVVDPH